MLQPLASTTADFTVIPLQSVLALHRALVRARAASVDLDPFLRDVTGILRAHLQAEGALIGLCDPTHNCLEQVVTSGMIPQRVADGCRGGSLPCNGRAGSADPDRLVLKWARDATQGEELQALAAAALMFRGEGIGLVCLFGSATSQRSWQQEAVSAAALEIGLAVAHLRLRRDVEDRLRERNERWSALYEMAVSLTREMDNDRLLDELVQRAVRLLRARGGTLSVRDEATGETVVTVAYVNGAPSEAMLGQRMPAGEGLVEQVMRSGRPAYFAEHRFVENGPSMPPVLTSVIAAPLFVQNAPVGALAVGDDPALRRFSEDDIQTVELLAQAAGAILEKAHGRNQERLLTIHRERARLSRELHDGLAQNLASLLLKAELCRELAGDASTELVSQLDLLAESIQQAVRETRAAISTLREAPSDGLRLMDALNLLAARFESQTGVPVALSSEGPVGQSFPSGAHMALLRVAQEALENVRKHACAQTVSAHLNAAHPKKLELTVHDDGCGFDASDLDAFDAAQRFGLRGMRERMEELGGSLSIETAPGRGVTVTAVLPLMDSGRL